MARAVHAHQRTDEWGKVSVKGSATTIACEVHLHDGGVMHEAIDGATAVPAATSNAAIKENA
jgi:hypothetical protein